MKTLLYSFHIQDLTLPKLMSWPFIILILLTLEACDCTKCKTTLSAGPMLSYNTMREVAVWVQTQEASSVQIVYWPIDSAKHIQRTDIYKTTKKDALTATCLLTGLEPGTRYGYKILVDEAETTNADLEFTTQTLWQHRTDPPSFSFVIGSCSYINEPAYDRPGAPYGSNYQIFNSIASQQPDFMVWAGDNTYLREPDWNSRSGIMSRYSHTRALPELQNLLSACHHYAIWDDHDYGPNDSDRSYWNKNYALEAFNLFWPSTNRAFKGESIAHTFQWNDCQFFMLDDRWFRTPNKRHYGPREMFGKKQLEWLADALTFSTASFKFIVSGGQLLNPNAKFEAYSIFEEERKEFLHMLDSLNVPGIILMSGDIHHTEMAVLERKNDYPLYELTVSPLTSGVYPGGETIHPLIMKGTVVNEHNFAKLEIDGSYNKRQLKISCFNAQNELKWERTISQLSLK